MAPPGSSLLEVALSPPALLIHTPIGPGAPQEGCLYRRVLCERYRRYVGGGRRGLGRGYAE
jgi:hypothetical protein